MNTPDAEPPTPGHRVAEFLDLVMMHAGDSLRDLENRVRFADFVMGLFRRAELVPAERAAEIILRNIAVGLTAVTKEIHQQLEAEALAAIGRGE